MVQTLLPVIFGYSLNSEAVVKEIKEVIDTLTQEDFNGALQKLFEWHNN